MEISNIQKSNNKGDDLISILEELENSKSSVKFDKAVAIAKDLINQNEVLANEKEEWEKIEASCFKKYDTEDNVHLVRSSSIIQQLARDRPENHNCSKVVFFVGRDDPSGEAFL